MRKLVAVLVGVGMLAAVPASANAASCSFKGITGYDPDRATLTTSCPNTDIYQYITFATTQGKTCSIFGTNSAVLHCQNNVDHMGYVIFHVQLYAIGGQWPAGTNCGGGGWFGGVSSDRRTLTCEDDLPFPS